MATVTPPPRVPFQARRLMYSIPRSGNSHAPKAPMERSEGGGANPLRAAGYQDTSGQGDFISPPIHVGGLIGLGLDPARDREYEQRVNARDTANMAKVQSGVDAFMQAYSKSGDAQQALASVFHPDNEGHVHFSDPQTFNAIMAIHQAVGQGGQGQFQTVDLGHGLTGVVDPSGKASVHNQRDFVTPGNVISAQRLAQSSAGQPKMTKDAQGRVGRYNPQTNEFEPATEGGQPIAGKAPPERTTTKAQMDQLTDLQTVLGDVQKMRQSAGATGSLGYGRVTRALAEHTPLGGNEAETYNAAFNDMKQALMRLSRVPGNSKLVAEAALERMPDPHDATPFLVNQSLPMIEYRMRQQVGQLYQTYKAENRVGGMEAAGQIAKTYNAHPDQMADLDTAKNALQNNPGQMTDDQVALLAREMDHMPYDEWTRTARQMVQRGMVAPDKFDKWVAASPDLAQISDQERIANPRPFQNPTQPAAAPIPTGPDMAPGAPAQPAQAPQQPQAPQAQKTAFPPQAASGVPQQPAPQPGVPPQQLPASGQQQAQAPQQIEQQQAAQAPPGQAGNQAQGVFSSLMNHIGTAIQNHIPAFLQSQGQTAQTEDSAPDENE